MSRVHQLKSMQYLPAPLDQVWQFFSDPHNLSVITPPFLNLKVTNEVYGDEVYTGQIMTYTVRPLLGIPLHWMTEITHVEKGRLFVDEQRKGPYRLWHHQHHFREVEGGVEMTDLVHYRLPFGILDALSNPLLVKGKLEEIFTFRYQKIIELFGAWPGRDIQLKID